VGLFRDLSKPKKMTTYTASWPDKQTVTISQNEKPFGRIEFENTQGILYGNALLHVADTTFAAQVDGKNTAIKSAGAEIFTAIFHSLWGNLELRMAGEDTGYDIKGKWFKPGTRLTDDGDNDLVVVTADSWTGKKMEIIVADEGTAPLMIVATIYFHIRASAAKTMGVIIGNMP
jgi:hypothetical protein